MHKLKPISQASLESAQDKAERYRLLNEPMEAESIARDILAVAPDNQRAMITLLLAITDQFSDEISGNERRARELIPQLGTRYAQRYYSGMIAERRAKAILRRGMPGHGPMVYAGLREAMECYAEAEAERPPDNDDAILRWNACARLIDSRPELCPEDEEEEVHLQE